MPDECSTDILSKGIQKARNERAAQEARLKETYNKASCLLKGLAELRDMPGSTFKFDVVASRAGDRLFISTNVPTPDSYSIGSTLSINISPSGRACAYGERPRGRNKAQRISAFRQKKATEKVLEFTALRAARRGLVP